MSNNKSANDTSLMWQVCKESSVFMLMSGLEITHDLIQLLQKRLDDAVLNEIILTLSRNPMYKLSPEDVQVNVCSVQY